MFWHVDTNISENRTVSRSALQIKVKSIFSPVLVRAAQKAQSTYRYGSVKSVEFGGWCSVRTRNPAERPVTVQTATSMTLYTHPYTGTDRSLGLQEAEVPRFQDNRYIKVDRTTHRPPLPPRRYSWYSFLLDAESNPEQWCGRKDYVDEKFQ